LELISALHGDFLGFAKNDSRKRGASAEGAWIENERALVRNVLNNDIRLFLQWEVVRNTMFTADAEFLTAELAFLKASPDWPHRWSNAVRESTVGTPITFSAGSTMSGNTIHHAYHLAQFEQATGVPIDSMRVIFEFGGGYGSMCRIIHQLGFKGTYIIFDLPTFSSLQKYYLGANMLPVVSRRPAEPLEGIYCLSTIDDLNSLLRNQSDGHRGLFISTWALSESPRAARDRIEKFMRKQNYFLLAYQDRFFEIDNRAYFDDILSRAGTTRWHHADIGHIPNSYYLFGQPQVSKPLTPLQGSSKQ
jgi:hypothetical protein